MSPTTCKHYRSPIHQETCSLGINYLELAGQPREGYLARLPCVRGSPICKPGPPCEKRELPTEEEVKAENKKMTNRVDKMCQAIKAIREEKKNSGTIECPECKKRLHYNVAKLNGHIWGKCETENCLTWMM